MSRLQAANDRFSGMGIAGWGKPGRPNTTNLAMHPRLGKVGFGVWAGIAIGMNKNANWTDLG